MDHLACFVPAMLALGAHAGAVQGEQYDLYMTLARNLTRTCWEMYNQMPTGALFCLPSWFRLDFVLAATLKRQPYTPCEI